MFLQKIRAFFEWLGKRSTAKSRKALDYEWTTMNPEGGTPVKTVDLGESEKMQRAVPVKSVDIGEEKPVEVKAVQTEKPVQAESQSENGDAEARMAVILKTFTIRDAVNLLQQKFERAADVRRSRVALLAFLQQTPEAVLFLEEKVKEKKAAVKKPAVRKSNVKKTAAKKSTGGDAVEKASVAESAVQSEAQKEKKTTSAKPSARKPASTKTAGKRTTAKKPAVRKPEAKTQSEQASSQPTAPESAAADTESK